MLPQIAEAVGKDIEIMFDGGIRSGQDIMRALALGAKSCMIGRAYVYGLGAAGQAGVARAIEILGKELDVTMALCGVSKLSDIGPQVIVGGRAAAPAPVAKPAPATKPAQAAAKPRAAPKTPRGKKSET
jgi:L-lactate dehydrogenase (cytochrome)